MDDQDVLQPSDGVVSSKHQASLIDCLSALSFLSPTAAGGAARLTWRAKSPVASAPATGR